MSLLEELMDGEKILVFCSSKRRCDALTRDLRVDGWPALTIHGDKAQEERDWVLQQFKDGEQPLLIATNPSPSPSPSPDPNPNPNPSPNQVSSHSSSPRMSRSTGSTSR